MQGKATLGGRAALQRAAAAVAAGEEQVQNHMPRRSGAGAMKKQGSELGLWTCQLQNEGCPAPGHWRQGYELSV